MNIVTFFNESNNFVKYVSMCVLGMIISIIPFIIGGVAHLIGVGEGYVVGIIITSYVSGLVGIGIGSDLLN